MTRDNYEKLMDAIDMVCLNCTQDTLEDNSCCEHCPVRQTVDYIQGIELTNEKKTTTTEEFRNLQEGDKFWIGGIEHTAACCTDYCGQADCADELVIYDTDGNGFFAEDFTD